MGFKFKKFCNKLNRFFTKFHEGIFKIFEASIFIKGIDGVLEIIGGSLLLSFIKADEINRFILYITEHELIQDPNDVFANGLVNWASHLYINGTIFGGFYLLFHGFIKIFLAVFLLKKKIWAYPITMVLLTIFAFYQFYKYAHIHTLILLILGIFDLLTAWLIWIVWKQIKKGNIV